MREGSTEMLWLFGPNLSSLPSVTLRNFYCRFGRRWVLLSMIVGREFASS